MRVIPAVMTVLLLVTPSVASAQTFGLQGSAGPTMTDPGHSLAAGVHFSPTSWLTLMIDLERTHIPSQIRTYEDGVTAAFRGGTITLASPAVQVSPLGSDRVGPYGLVGLAAGVSRPNVTDLFPGRVSNQVRAPFAGGGIQVPLRNRVTLFAEARMMLVVGKEADELFALAPFRAGIAWRF